MEGGRRKGWSDQERWSFDRFCNVCIPPREFVIFCGLLRLVSSLLEFL